jgi:hypothetical protein
LAAALAGRVQIAAVLDREVLEGLEVVQDTITPQQDQLHLGRVTTAQAAHSSLGVEAEQERQEHDQMEAQVLRLQLQALQLLVLEAAVVDALEPMIIRLLRVLADQGAEVMGVLQIQLEALV